MSYLRKGRSVERLTGTNSSSASSAPPRIPNTIQIGNKAGKSVVIPPRHTANPITQPLVSHSQGMGQGATPSLNLIPNTINLAQQQLNSALHASAVFIRRRSMLDCELKRQHANDLHKPVSRDRASLGQIEKAIVQGEEDVRDATEKLKDLNLAIENKGKDVKPVKDSQFPKVRGLGEIRSSRKEDLQKKAQKGLIRGKGKHTVGRQAIDVVPLGCKFISPSFLALDPPEIYLRYGGQGKTKFLHEETSRDLADILLYYLEHHKLPAEVKDLNSAEHKLLHDILLNVKVMSDEEKKASVLRMVSIVHGEMKAGNDNKELPELLKKYLQEAVDYDYMTEKETEEYLQDVE